MKLFEMSIFGEYTKKKVKSRPRPRFRRSLISFISLVLDGQRDKPANRAVNKWQAKSKARILRAQGTGTTCNGEEQKL